MNSKYLVPGSITLLTIGFYLYMPELNLLGTKTAWAAGEGEDKGQEKNCPNSAQLGVPS